MRSRRRSLQLSIGVSATAPLPFRSATSQLQTVVGQRGYFPADMPVKDYPADFVSGCLVAAWPQVLEMICTNRDVPF